MTRSSDHENGTPTTGGDPSEVTLDMSAERRLIGRGSFRHIDFRVRVSPSRTVTPRPPLAIGLVLDRSGSMSGAKIETARRAALAVLEQLKETDRVAAVIFDEHIDTLQAGAPATPEVKARLRAELSAVQARGSTALHEGWLTGCKAIAPSAADATLTRCFLLTDGLANVGLTDPEQIASEAAGVREHARVGTSTFGIGDTYAESLLGPMAVAGGGQFHNLRSPEEIARTFLGELGELFSVAALSVALEIDASPWVDAELVSPYWPRQTAAHQWSIALGDLLAGEERHVIVRFAFGAATAGGTQLIRARLTWLGADGAQRSGPWREIAFEPADSAARGAEIADPSVMQIVGQHHADRARRTAIARSREGDVDGARKLLRLVAGRISEYAGDDATLQQALLDLQTAEGDLAQFGYQAAPAREAYYASQVRSRGQRDLRER